MTLFSEAFSVHPTDELPMMMLRANVFEFAGGKHLEVMITPNIIRADESLEALDPSDRLCYLEGERKLRFFKVYTKHNCEVECFSNSSREVCNCVSFDVVRDPDTKVCDITDDDVSCHFEMMKEFIHNPPTGRRNLCSCLSLCDSVSYNIEVRESKLQDRFDNLTQFTFKFSDDDFHPLCRTRRFTTIDFLSNVGGVLGLFAGISVLSFFEAFYFFTLRIWSNIIISRKAVKHAVIMVEPVK